MDPRHPSATEKINSRKISFRRQAASRTSYTDLDSTCWVSTVVSGLPIAPVNSFDQSSRPSSVFKNSRFLKDVERKLSLVGTEPETLGSNKDLKKIDSNTDLTRLDSKTHFLLDEPSSNNRFPNIAKIFSDDFRMPGSTSKDPPYRHLRESPSVDSYETPPPIDADHDSSISAIDRSKSVINDRSMDDRMSSGVTMSTTITNRMMSAKISLDHTKSDSNEDDTDPNMYHPFSPRIDKKPMIFESASSNNFLKVPETVIVGAAVVIGPSVENENPNNLFGDKKLFEHRNLTQNGHRRNSSKRTQEYSKPGCYFDDGIRRVDFILAYEKGHSPSLEHQRQYFETNLQQEGLVLESDSLDNDDSNKLCFVRVHAPWNALCRFAEIMQMKMPLRNATVPHNDLTPISNTRGIFGTIKEFLLSAFDFNDTEKILIGSAPRHVTAQFTRARVEKFLINDPDTFFTPTQRIRIVYEIMQKAKCDPNDQKKRGVQWLLKGGVYAAAYPPHDGEAETRHINTNEPWKWSQRQILKHTWANFNRLFKPQPLHLIRAYFGEKIGFYFAWLGFYTQMLIFPSIVGVICFIAGIFSSSSNQIVVEMCSGSHTDKNFANITMCPVCRMPYCRPWKLNDGCESAHWNYRFDNETHVIMAVFTLLWATVFMELWKRKEAELAAEWDAYDAEQGDEPTRPEYEARTKITRISPITNEDEPYISPYRRAYRLAVSTSGGFVLILMVVLALMGLITVRIVIYGILSTLGGVWDTYKFEIASIVIHGCTFSIVMFLGVIYEPTAHRLTELECPKTQADYLSSYIWKVFVFELLNNFVPIFYAALIRGRFVLPHNQDWLTEMCDPGGCLNEVVQAIAILLLARLLISNAAELGVPFLKKLLKSKGMGKVAVHPEHESSIRKLPRWQRDFALNEPDLDGVYAEYLEMMVQFGYATLFVAAFPLAPLICLLNNIAEIRIDATNFVTSFRRPLPARVSGIRIWRRFLNIIIKLSVLCNGAFLAFTSELIPTLVYRYSVSEDGSTKGYTIWAMSQTNTTGWPDFKENAILAGIDPEETTCFYRDFRENNEMHDFKFIWWQIMVVRLVFFVVFIVSFYFIQWLCDFLLSSVPRHVKLKVHRSNFLARQSLYGEDAESNLDLKNHTGYSPSPMMSNSRRLTGTTVTTTVPQIDPSEHIQNGHIRTVNIRNSSATPNFSPNANGVMTNGHMIHESTEDFYDQWENDIMHPNHPLGRRPSFRHMNGKSAALSKSQTITSNV